MVDDPHRVRFGESDAELVPELVVTGFGRRIVPDSHAATLRLGHTRHVTPAIRELEAAGVAFGVLEYERGDDLHDVGMHAASKLGIDPDQVFKTLLVSVDGGQAVAIVPVSGRLSLKSVGRALGSKRVEMCELSVAERVTGYVRGGISPFGQKKRLPTVLDEMAFAFDEIHVSGGRRGLDISVTPAELVRLLDAAVADLLA